MARRRKASTEKVERIFKSYESVAELAATLRDAEPHKDWECYSPFRYSDATQRSWAGETLTDAIKKLDTGDAEAAAKIHAQGDITCGRMEGNKPVIESHIIGCMPCVPNYLRGVPNSMLRVKTIPRHKPTIDMYVNATIYDGIDVDKVAKKAYIIANVIAATEAAGVRVNLYAAIGMAWGSSSYCGYTVKIKDARAPLNLLNIGFSICNRAFCRAIGLRWMEQNVPHYVQNYGRLTTIQELARIMQLDGIKIDLCNMVRYDYGMEWLSEQVNEYLK